MNTYTTEVDADIDVVFSNTLGILTEFSPMLNAVTCISVLVLY